MAWIFGHTRAYTSYSSTGYISVSNGIPSPEQLRSAFAAGNKLIRVSISETGQFQNKSFKKKPLDPYTPTFFGIGTDRDLGGGSGVAERVD